MITEWIYHNQALELHDEQGLLCSWLADATKHGYLASLLNRFPAIGNQMAQLIRTNPAIERARAHLDATQQAAINKAADGNQGTSS
jgi:hypothetical protein